MAQGGGVVAAALALGVLLAQVGLRVHAQPDMVELCTLNPQKYQGTCPWASDGDPANIGNTLCVSHGQRLHRAHRDALAALSVVR